MRAQFRLCGYVYSLLALMLIAALVASALLGSWSQLQQLRGSGVPLARVDANPCPQWMGWVDRQLGASPWQLICASDGVMLAVRDSAPLRALHLSSLLLEQGLRAWQQQWPIFAALLLLPPWLVAGLGRRQGRFEARARALAELMAERSGISPHRRGGETLSVLEHTFSRMQERLDEHRAEIARAEYADRLTGLANRYQFQLALEQSLSHARDSGHAMALLFIDLDGFKQVNDSYGHSMGDLLLVRVAERLRAATRASDLVARDKDGLGELARLGGDEFTVILGEINEPEAAARVAFRIIKGLEAPFEVGGNTLNISASIGIAVYPEDGDNSEMLLQRADVAMYRAKAEGKGTYRRYANDMGKQVVRQHYLSLELRKALDQAQFYLEFQPIVELPGNQVRYFEALLRWQHPLEGAIMPAEFIPIAEESRQILALGDWVVQESLVQLARWQKAGLRKARISINVSSVQIRQLDLHEWLTAAMLKAGVNPRGVMMEITESCLIEAGPETVAQLTALRRDGVQVALDDFGTGYSSLAVLASLPIDVIKVDRSFVNKACGDAKYRDVLASVVTLARKLNLELVAEGVETAAELALLNEMGCRLIQGFLISRPTAQTALNQELMHRQLANLSSLGTGVWPPQTS